MTTAPPTSGEFNAFDARSYDEKMKELMSDAAEDFAPEWTEVCESFDDMGLHENLLRGIYAYGFEKPSAIQQRGISLCAGAWMSSSRPSPVPVRPLPSAPESCTCWTTRCQSDMLRRRALRQDYIKVFALDEADEMLSRGFKDQIYDIFQLLPEKLQVGVFSATMPPEALEITRKFMAKPVRILVKREELTLEGIKQFYVDCDR